MPLILIVIIKVHRQLLAAMVSTATRRPISELRYLNAFHLQHQDYNLKLIL